MDFMKQLVQSEEMRRHMVDSQLRTNGVSTPWIITAMLDLPREYFMLGDGAAAYRDRAVALTQDRQLNPPLATGLMLDAAAPCADDKALIIGAATGYLASLLSPRVARLISVEEDAALAAAFKVNVPAMMLVEGPLAMGASDHGPYDLIIIDGSIEQLPNAIVDQLVDGGRIVTGLMDGPVSRLAIGIKHSGHLRLRTIIDTEIAPLPGFSRTKEFVF
jgi:protein-L-isoaspartate(D-aspartate) O-methyltransferase